MYMLVFIVLTTLTQIRDVIVLFETCEGKTQKMVLKNYPFNFQVDENVQKNSL